MKPAIAAFALGTAYIKGGQASLVGSVLCNILLVTSAAMLGGSDSGIAGSEH